jgi:hypothetical protein
MEENSAYSRQANVAGESGFASADANAVQQGAALTDDASSNVTTMPGLSQAWDPYDVWLNRVRKPREQSAVGVPRAFVLTSRWDREPTRKRNPRLL